MIVRMLKTILLSVYGICKRGIIILMAKRSLPAIVFASVVVISGILLTSCFTYGTVRRTGYSYDTGHFALYGNESVCSCITVAEECALRTGNGVSALQCTDVCRQYRCSDKSTPLYFGGDYYVVESNNFYDVYDYNYFSPGYFRRFDNVYYYGNPNNGGDFRRFGNAGDFRSFGNRNDFRSFDNNPNDFRRFDNNPNDFRTLR